MITSREPKSKSWGLKASWSYQCSLLTDLVTIPRPLTTPSGPELLVSELGLNTPSLPSPPPSCCFRVFFPQDSHKAPSLNETV